jgi:hypothetical protein
MAGATCEAHFQSLTDMHSTDACRPVIPHQQTHGIHLVQVAGTLSKSTEVMKLVNDMMRVRIS